MQSRILIFTFVGALATRDSAAYSATKVNCTKPEGPAICCVNHIHSNDGLCHPCENGIYGVECSLRCPRFHYGRFCVNKCDCMDDKDCDPRNGKCELQLKVDVYSEKGCSFPTWILIIGCAVVAVLVLVFISFGIKRDRTNCLETFSWKNTTEPCTSTSSYQEIVPGSAAQTANEGYSILRSGVIQQKDIAGYLLPAGEIKGQSSYQQLDEFVEDPNGCSRYTPLGPLSEHLQSGAAEIN